MGRSNYTVAIVTDAGVIRNGLAVMEHEIREDGAPHLSDWTPDEGDVWLGVFRATDLELCGLYQLDALTGSMCVMHINIDPDHRKDRHAIHLAVYGWLLDNSHVQKVVGLIPVCHRHIRRFAVEMGGTEEGRIGGAYRKHGLLHDMWVIGVSRKNMEELCHL